MSSNEVNANDGQSSDKRICPFCGIVGLCWLEYELLGTVPCSNAPPTVKQNFQSGKQGDEENTEEKNYCANLPPNRTCHSDVNKIQPKLTHAPGIRKRLRVESSGNVNRLELLEGPRTSTDDSWLIEGKKSFGRVFYENGIDFDVAKSSSFCKMSSLGFGPNIQIPTCDELQGWIRENESKEIGKYVTKVRSSWVETGSSILIDGWANNEGQNFISIFVDSPKGTIYLRSFDVSNFHADLDAMKLLFEQVIAEVGINNVVQIITYSTSAFMKEIGKQLMEKYKSIYWTVDTYCCFDLMIEKYGAIVSETLEKAKTITRFVYKHPQVIKLLLDHPQVGELVALSKTKLALSFFTLENIVSKEKILKEIFISLDSQTAIVTSTTEGKRVADLFGDESFWSNAWTVVTSAIPLVRAMELMNTKRSHMECIYETMDQVKETIKEGFGNKKSRYMQFWNVIDEIWCNHLHSELHAAGYFLNPTIFYSEDVCIDMEVFGDLTHCITHMAKDLDTVQVTTEQLKLYQNALGNFAEGSAVEKRSNVSPVDWWYKYGGECPELQKLAVRILSQTCNGASRFQLERSLVENLFKRKSNQIEHERLNKMAFLQYNMHLSKLASGENDCMVSDEIHPGCDWIVDMARD